MGASTSECISHKSLSMSLFLCFHIVISLFRCVIIIIIIIVFHVHLFIFLLDLGKSENVLNLTKIIRNAFLSIR